MKMATQTKRLVAEVVKLRAARARDLARYQEHLSQKVRALEANKVTIADMNLELKQLRDSYDAKREHANALAAELARHVEARKAAGRPHPKGTRIDSPKNWALLNQRDEQWKLSLVDVIRDVEMITTSLRVFLGQGPTPPMQPAANATEKGTAADGMPEIRVTVPAESHKPGDPVEGGNGVWYNKRRKKARKK